MDSVIVSLVVFFIGFVISLFMAAMIKGLIALICRAEKKMAQTRSR